MHESIAFAHFNVVTALAVTGERSRHQQHPNAFTSALGGRTYRAWSVGKAASAMIY